MTRIVLTGVEGAVEQSGPDEKLLDVLDAAERDDRMVPVQIEEWQLDDELCVFDLVTSRGTIVGIRHGAETAPGCVVMVSDELGGLGGPSGLYHDLGEMMRQLGHRAIRISPREPIDVAASALDVLMVARVALSKGASKLVLCGHGLGAVAAAQAATVCANDLAGVAMLAPVDTCTDDLSEIVVPVFVLHGEADAIVDVRDGADIAKAIGANAIFEPVEGLGHSMSERREAVRNSVATFMARVLEVPIHV